MQIIEMRGEMREVEGDCKNFHCFTAVDGSVNALTVKVVSGVYGKPSGGTMSTGDVEGRASWEIKVC